MLHKFCGPGAPLPTVNKEVEKVFSKLKHVTIVDFGLYFFHNIKPLMERGSATYFYLPKLEHYLEARWWNEVFVFAQDYLNIPQDTIKATVLIETITASFQLDEIIYELKDHMAGLNCGRWDYIFSYIKRFRNHQNFLVPNRDQVTMSSPFMKAYSQRVVQRCHKRGQWMIQKYDVYGRQILTALYSSNLDQMALQQYFNQQS